MEGSSSSVRAGNAEDKEVAVKKTSSSSSTGVGGGEPVKVVYQREGVTVTVTFHSPVSGIYVIMRRTIHPDVNRYFVKVHNVDTDELAVSVIVYGYGERNEFPGRKYTQHVLVDQAATKLVFVTYYHSGYSFDVWSLTTHTFLHSIRFSDCATAFLSVDGTKLFFDHRQENWPQKAISIADVDTGALLWTTELAFGRLYFTLDETLMSSFSLNNDFLAIAFTEYIRDDRGNVTDRLTLRFHNSWSGAVENAVVMSPFSADLIQVGFGDHAVMIAGAYENKQPAVLLVGIDLVSTRIVLSPESIPETPECYRRNIRFGPPNMVFVHMNFSKVAKVVSFDRSAEAHGKEVAVREQYDVTLSRVLGARDNFVTHVQSNRFAYIGDLYGTDVHILDASTGNLLNIFKAPTQVLKVGVMEPVVCILL
jgi:hypothetical protein